MRTFGGLITHKRTYVDSEARVVGVSSAPEVTKCLIPETADIRHSTAGLLPETGVKRTQGWSANGPDGSCGGTVARRNLKGGAGNGRATEVSAIPMQVDLR